MNKPKKKRMPEIYGGECIERCKVGAYNQACDDWQKYHNAVLEDIGDTKKIEKIIIKTCRGHNDFPLCVDTIATAISKMIKEKKNE